MLSRRVKEHHLSQSLFTFITGHWDGFGHFGATDCDCVDVHAFMYVYWCPCKLYVPLRCMQFQLDKHLKGRA